MECPNFRGFPGCGQWIDGSTRGQAAVNTLEPSAPLNWLCTLLGGKLISAQLTIKGLKAQEVLQVELAEGIDGLGLRRFEERGALCLPAWGTPRDTGRDQS